MAQNRVIGKDNQLPWHFSEDLKHFKQLTMGSTIIMGRKTYESIGKPLPGRENFVLSRSVQASGEDHLRFFDSLQDALKAVKTPKAFIIGGEQLFIQTMDKVDGIYLTRIHRDYTGDVFYPEIPLHEFKQTETKILKNSDPQIDIILYDKKPQ